MIRSLRRRILLVIGVAFVIVSLLTFFLSYSFSDSVITARMNQTSDALMKNSEEDDDLLKNVRYYSVVLNNRDRIISENIKYISNISSAEVGQNVNAALQNGNPDGWIGDIFFAKYDEGEQKTIFFIDASSLRQTTRAFANEIIGIQIIVSLSLSLVAFVITLILTKKMTHTFEETYKRQKQFITDSSHELKTPITLIRTNIEIAEGELGYSEWLQDAKLETQRLTMLVNRLTELSRLEENKIEEKLEIVDISAILQHNLDKFEVLGEERNISLKHSINPGLKVKWNTDKFKKLISILLENAYKYCDDDGEIFVKAEKQLKTVICFENTYKDVDNVELDKLFERFYRSDEARTFLGGFGVGLSMAKIICEDRGGSIVAYKKNNSRIGFKITL